MPSTTVYNMAGEAVDQLELSEQVFGVTPNMAVLHQVVTAQLVNRRQGNASPELWSAGTTLTGTACTFLPVWFFVAARNFTASFG